MITSSGPKCDVCGNFIMPFGDEMVNCFSVKGIDRELHCDNKCKIALENAANDWRKLPYGPLKLAFIEASS